MALEWNEKRDKTTVAALGWGQSAESALSPGAQTVELSSAHHSVALAQHTCLNCSDIKTVIETKSCVTLHSDVNPYS